MVGHQQSLAQLEADLADDRLSHAYLFSGPDKTGKTEIARMFAQILHCPNDFCGSCPTCAQVAKGQHLDTLEFLDDGESFKIETMRELLSHLSTTAADHYKIILIQNIERMTPEAANSFLKNLEEPISGVVFLLTTADFQQVLPTLLSRVRKLAFHPLSERTLRDHLASLRPDMDPQTLDQMARFALGRSGRALELLNDADAFRQIQSQYQQLVSLMQNSSLNDRFGVVEELVQDDVALRNFLELFAHVTRHFLVEKAEGSQIPYSYDQLFAMVKALHQARFDLDHNVNPRLALEQLMLSF